MERFRGIVESRHQYAQDWKVRTGGKVLAYFCPYLPEEVVYAAGILPVRLMARHEPDDVSERYMYGNCPVTRDILNQAMKGRYDYVDGLGHAYGSQWMRSAFSSWLLHKPTEYNHFVFLPTCPDAPGTGKLTTAEVTAFKKSLEEWTGKVISNAAIDNAIEVYNTNRRLMRQVYELRRLDNPSVSGAEAMEMVMAGQVMDKAEHNRLLADALRKLQRRGKPHTGVRLMLLGSDSHDTELERLIESLGATVVVDELCNGSGYFWNDVITQQDRLLAIAMRYLDKPRCPMKDNGYRRRPSHITQLAEDYNVQGVIIAVQRFCHPHQYDNPAVTNALKERQIPFQYLDRDTTLPAADTRMRMEAFVQMLQPGTKTALSQRS